MGDNITRNEVKQAQSIEMTKGSFATGTSQEVWVELAFSAIDIFTINTDQDKPAKSKVILTYRKKKWLTSKLD